MNNTNSIRSRFLIWFIFDMLKYPEGCYLSPYLKVLQFMLFPLDYLLYNNNTLRHCIDRMGYMIDGRFYSMRLLMSLKPGTIIETEEYKYKLGENGQDTIEFKA